MYDFSELKKYVEQELGINTENAKSSFTIIRERLTFKGLQENIHIDNEGIFYIDDDGKKHKGFLYIEIFDPVEWKKRGWNEVPTFHITNCNVIERQKNRKNFDGHYVFSNQPVTDVKDANGIEHDLPVCSNCMKLTPEFNSVINSTTYIKDYLKPNFTDSDLPKTGEKSVIDVDMFGYTPDWEEKSKNYMQRTWYF